MPSFALLTCGTHYWAILRYDLRSLRPIDAVDDASYVGTTCTSTPLVIVTLTSRRLAVIGTDARRPVCLVSKSEPSVLMSDLRTLACAVCSSPRPPADHDARPLETKALYRLSIVLRSTAASFPEC